MQKNPLFLIISASILIIGLYGFQNCSPNNGSSGNVTAGNANPPPSPSSQIKKVEPTADSVTFTQTVNGSFRYATLSLVYDTSSDSSPANATNCQIEGGLNSPWMVLDNTCPNTLSPMQQCAIVLKYSPTASTTDSIQNLKFSCQKGGSVQWSLNGQSISVAPFAGNLTQISSFGFPPSPFVTLFENMGTTQTNTPIQWTINVKNNAASGGSTLSNCVAQFDQAVNKFSVASNSCSSNNMAPQQICSYGIHYESAIKSIDSAKFKIVCDSGETLTIDFAGQAYAPCNMGTGTFGICVVRTGSANLPNYCAFDNGVDYVKTGVGPAGYSEAQTLCTNTIWQHLGILYCPQFGGSVQCNVGLSNGDGGPNTSGGEPGVCGGPCP